MTPPTTAAPHATDAVADSLAIRSQAAAGQPGAYRPTAPFPPPRIDGARNTLADGRADAHAAQPGPRRATSPSPTATSPATVTTARAPRADGAHSAVADGPPTHTPDGPTRPAFQAAARETVSAWFAGAFYPAGHDGVRLAVFARNVVGPRQLAVALTAVAADRPQPTLAGRGGPRTCAGTGPVAGELTEEVSR